jgi:hypothetical protein
MSENIKAKTVHLCGLLCWASGCAIGGIPSPTIYPPARPLTARDVFGEVPLGSKFENYTPIRFASAPAHAERRKGQRYLGGLTGDVYTLIRPSDTPGYWIAARSTDGAQRHVGIEGNADLTLIADAPACALTGATACTRRPPCWCACWPEAAR